MPPIVGHRVARIVQIAGSGLVGRGQRRAQGDRRGGNRRPGSPRGPAATPVRGASSAVVDPPVRGLAAVAAAHDEDLDWRLSRPSESALQGAIEPAQLQREIVVERQIAVGPKSTSPKKSSKPRWVHGPMSRLIGACLRPPGRVEDPPDTGRTSRRHTCPGHRRTDRETRSAARRLPSRTRRSRTARACRTASVPRRAPARPD